jgi:hypothetical protein
MNPRQVLLARIVSRIRVVLTFSCAALIVWKAVEGQWTGAAVAFGVMISISIGRGLALAALGIAAGTGQWLAVVVAAVGLVVETCQRFVFRQIRPDPPDVGQLGAVPAMLPAELRSELAAAAEPDGIIDTPTILRCAIAADPVRWAPLTPAEVPSRTGSEGGLIGGNWTWCAAEAALVTTFLDPADVNVHGLALGAVSIPGAACRKGGSVIKAAHAAAGYGPERVKGALKAAALHPGGRLILTRMSQTQSGTRTQRLDELPDARWRTLGLPISTGGVSTSPSAVRAAPVAKSPEKLEPDRQRPPAPVSEGGPPTPANLQPASPKTASPKTASPKTASPKTARPKTATKRRRREGPWRLARGEWPAAALITWWVVRPAATVVAAAFAVADFFGGAALPAVACLLIALFVRPTRSPWLGVVAAAGAWWLDPAVGLSIVARTLAGVATLLLVGPGWRAGTSSLVRLRRRLTGVPDLDEAWEQLLTALRSPDDTADYLEFTLKVLVAAWVTASLPAMVTTAVRAGKGLLFGRWPVPGAQRLWEAVARLYVVGEIADRAIGMLATLATFLVCWLAVPGQGHTIFGFHVYAWASAASAAWFCRSIGRRGPIVERIPSVTVVGLIVLIASGHDSPLNLGIAGVIALTGIAARRGLESSLLSRRVRPPRLLGGLRSLRIRDQWIAACGAVKDDQPQIAKKLWRQITQNDRLPAPARAGALAALADLALSTGDLQVAVEQAGRAVGLADRGPRSCGPVYAVAGRVSLAAGDNDRARYLLNHRTIKRRDRGEARYAAARVELLALDGDADRAMAELESTSTGLFRTGRMEDSINHEVTVLSRLLAAGAPKDAIRRRLDTVIGFDGGDLAAEAPRAAGRLIATLGRARVLLGRVQLLEGDAPAAAATLRRAVSDLDGPDEAMDRASARVMLGGATAEFNRTDALRVLATGIDELERARGALRAGLHRSQLITRHAPAYEIALDTLSRLRPGNPQAGWLAAQLCESLCRSALARTLRQRELGISAQGRQLLSAISRLEAQAQAGTARYLDELAELRDQLRSLLSDTFATAYLPGAVDFGQLRPRLGSAHALSYRVHEATSDVIRGHVVWTPPGPEAPEIAGFSLDTSAMLELLGLRGKEARDRHMSRFSIGADGQRWRDLGIALLPVGLRTTLSQASNDEPEHIVIVPDGPLTVLPWAAIRLDDGRFLAEAASLQHTPTLDLLERHRESAEPRPAPREVAVYLDPAIRTAKESRLIQAFHDTRLVGSLDQFCDCLTDRSPVGAYVAAHGEGAGLEQHVTFGDSGILSAAAALGYPWPAWTIFASCLVGGLEYDLGEDPLGLPVSCLIGGGQSVVGGVIEVTDATSGPMAASIAVRLDAPAAHPAEALRKAQLGFLWRGRTRRSPEPKRWAGYVCLSRLVPPRCLH